MDYRDDTLRDALAAEYVLGTLRGRARQRFEGLLRADPVLRRRVQAWQERLAALDAAIAPVAPPARAWHAIEARIRPASGAAAERWWNSLHFWRTSALAGLAAVVVLSISLGLLLPREPEMMVAVMSDGRDQPAMTVSWQMDTRGQTALRIRVMGHAEMAQGTAWELWALPEDGGPPVSLGLITTHETQTVMLPPRLTRVVDGAAEIAMSVEPHGGSPTGAPTGPILYRGPCTRI